MFLLRWSFSPMNKRHSVAACKGRFGRRKDSAIRTLVAETLVLAKTHGYVEKIENELEEELARDISQPPAERIARWQRRGEKIFKSKCMLLAVAILCVTDCALVLGELILDLHKVKVTLEDTDKLTKATEKFVFELERQFPHLQTQSPTSVFTMILEANIFWNTSDSATVNASALCAPYSCSMGVPGGAAGRNISSIPVIDRITYEEHQKEQYILGHIAHAFHYASIAILGILLVETCLKALCAGKHFLHRKLEVFDAFIVFVSFIVDFAFLVFLPAIDTKDFVFILAILLPWRVIRVVNSLVVAVKDHEHFRLKLVYGRKKKIQSNLRDTENMMQKYRSNCTTLQRLCVMEGIDEWKIDHCLRNDDSIPPTPVKKKFKFRLDDNIFTGSRGPRCSLPSLELHGLKFSNGSVTKPRSSLPSIALQTLKSHISRSIPSRRASLATMDLYNTRVLNGDLNRKKIGSDDLSTMHEDTIMESVDSAVSSTATSEIGDKDTSRRPSLSDSIDSANTGSESTRSASTGVRRLQSESADSDTESARVSRLLQDSHRRHSETAVAERGQLKALSSFDDTQSYTDEKGKTYTIPKRKRSGASLKSDIQDGLGSPVVKDTDDCDSNPDTTRSLSLQLDNWSVTEVDETDSGKPQKVPPSRPTKCLFTEQSVDLTVQPLSPDKDSSQENSLSPGESLSTVDAAPPFKPDDVKTLQMNNNIGPDTGADLA